jgi:hypothetical protein
LVCALVTVLDHNNVLCLQDFLTLHNVELYTLAFFQVAVYAIVGEGAEMHEHIGAFRAFDEAERYAALACLAGEISAGVDANKRCNSDSACAREMDRTNPHSPSRAFRDCFKSILS